MSSNLKQSRKLNQRDKTSDTNLKVLPQLVSVTGNQINFKSQLPDNFCFEKFLAEQNIKHELYKKVNYLLNGRLTNFHQSTPLIYPALRMSINSRYLVGKFDLIPHVTAYLSKIKRVLKTIEIRQSQSKNYKFFDVIFIVSPRHRNLVSFILSCLASNKNNNLRISIISGRSSKVVASIARMNKKSTILVVLSKGLDEISTLKNSKIVLDWLSPNNSHESAYSDQIFVATSNPTKAYLVGCLKKNVIKIPDWIDNKYPVWGAFLIVIGVITDVKGIDEFLRGASMIDEHFDEHKSQNNIPICLGTILYFRNHFCTLQTRKDYNSQFFCNFLNNKQIITFVRESAQIRRSRNFGLSALHRPEITCENGFIQLTLSASNTPVSTMGILMAIYEHSWFVNKVLANKIKTKQLKKRTFLANLKQS